MIELFCLMIGLALSIYTTVNTDGFNSAWAILILPSFWLLFTLATAVVLLAILYVFSICLKKNPPDKPGSLCYFLVKLAIGSIIRCSRVRIHVKGGQLIEKGRSYLLVSNHRSKYDPLIQFYIFKRNKPIMISKPENMKIPIAGRVINRAGFLAIDRENNRAALKTILKASSFIENKYASIGVCPEGARNKKDRNLMPLKVGALKIATKSKAPIAVMTFEGTEKIHKAAPFKKSHVYLDILKIIRPDEYAELTTQELGDKIAKILQDNIDRYSKVICNGKE